MRASIGRVSALARPIVSIGFALLLGSSAARAVDTSGSLAAHSPAIAGQWITYGHTYSGQRFSPLNEINARNVTHLGLAWYARLAERGGAYETTPIVDDGAIYVTAPWSKVYAFDAKTGRRLWKYDPKVPGQWAVNLCCGIVNRGVAVWKGSVIWGTLDGRLIAVNAKSGKRIWQVQVTDPHKPQSITGAPIVADGLVFIGEGGSEFEQRGYVSAYDAATGKRVWRWWVVPGNPAKGFAHQPELKWAAKTWHGKWWKRGGGGTPWDGITFDPATGLLYIGTGNGAPWPAWLRSPGGGANLFTSSIVALDAKTGKFRWYYQEIPQDSFDFDSTSPIMTANLVVDGKQRHVVMQAPKDGIFYVLDAATGKLLAAKPFVPSVDWMTGFKANGEPILNPAANYGKTAKGFYIVPGPDAHSWYPMAFNPDTGLVYIPTHYGSFPLFAQAHAKMGNQLDWINIADCPKESAPRLTDPGSYLLAWDPVRMKAVWAQRQGRFRAGVLTTAGNLVFQGSLPHDLSAYRADTGERLWTTDTQSGIAGGPATYTIDGVQYIAVVSGTSGGFNRDFWAPTYARLLVYKLGGRAALAPTKPYKPPMLNPPPDFGSQSLLTLGQAQYDTHCASCHGNNGEVSSVFPDLRYVSMLWSSAACDAIVIDGALQSQGMVSFRKMVTPQDADAIRAYVVHLANQAKNAPHRGSGGPFKFCGGSPLRSRASAPPNGPDAVAHPYAGMPARPDYRR